MKGCKVILSFVVLSCLMALGCAGTSNTAKPGTGVTGSKYEPKWVSRGSGIYPGDKGKAIYAVGMASYEPNIRLQRKIAMQDARVELASQLKTYVAAMIKDFMQAHRDFQNPKSSSSIAFTQAVSKSVTEATLYGSQMINSWRNPDTKDLYVLVTMPVGEALKQAKSAMMKKAREKAAETFKKKADEALKALDTELEKRRKIEGGQ